MQVGHRMKTQVITIGPLESAAAAWGLLRAHKIRHLPVIEEGKVVGMVTDRDIRLVFPSGLTSGQKEQDAHDALERVSVRQIMASHVLTVTPETSIADAARILLERRIGGLPVIQGNRLVGIITKTDILAAFVELVQGGSQ